MDKIHQSKDIECMHGFKKKKTHLYATYKGLALEQKHTG